MRPVELPDPFSACVAAVVELGEDAGVADVDAWQERLAPRGLRLVEAAATPNAGFWIAAYADGAHAVMFGTPPGPVWQPAGGPPRAPEAATRAWVVQALDPALAQIDQGDRPTPGRVTGLYVAPAAEAPMQPLERVTAIPGRGLEGDRYAAGEGTFSGRGGTGRDVTLVEQEALGDIGLDGAAARRNVVTTGIDLNALVGRRFRIGAVECLGQRWCEPCAHLERLTRPGVLRALIHRGGLRADIVTPGEIARGDDISVI